MNDFDSDKTRGVLVLKPGATVAHYELIRKIGAGGMGEVYLARDTQLERKVALKFLPPTMALDSLFRERFIREARSAARLSHPNIITIYQVGEFEGYVYIAMEYIEGQSLRESIDSGHIETDRALDIAIQICEGLAVAHAVELIHRDIKPPNIMIDTTRRARILDFGLAKSAHDDQLTQAGTTMGTVSYMSPEQAQGEEPTHQSDIFAVGVVLYEMFTGQLPFKSSNMAATLYSIVNSTPEPICTLNPSAPAALQWIVDRALAKIPENRYATAQELGQDLKNLRQGQPTAQVTLAPRQPEPTATMVKALAILCLRNLGDSEDDFLSYGITEDLIIDLSHLGAIRVAPMRSILQFKDSHASVEDIARKLNVTCILDGSIHRNNGQVRVSAQLVDAISGETMWSERWQEDTEGLPRIKQALANGIVEALNVSTKSVKRAEVGRIDASDAEAYENYLKAKYSFECKREKLDVDVAMGLYALALKQEPNLVAARAGIAEIMLYNGDFSSAEIELTTALREAERHDSKVDQAAILHLMARMHTAQSSWDQARQIADRALKLARDTGDLAGEAKILGTMISILQPQAKFDEAVVLFDRVLQISRKLDDQEATAEALKNMGVAYARSGDYDRAVRLYAESLALAEKQDNLALQASCLSNTGNVHFYRSELDRAFDKYRQAYDIATKIGDRTLAGRQSLNMALIKLTRNERQEGLKLLDQAGDLFIRLGDKSTYSLIQVNRSQALLTCGKDHDAAAAAREALAIGKELGQPLIVGDAQALLGAIEFFRRNLNDARTHYEQALHTATEAGISRSCVHTQLALARLALYHKDFATCKSQAAAAQTLAVEIGEKAAVDMARAMLAAVEASVGLFNMGLRQLEETLQKVEQTDQPEELMQLTIITGQVLMEHGESDEDREEGRRMLQDALANAQFHHFAPEIKLIEEALSG